ncbi:thiol-disulfide isomerase [Steroidobacter agaridevorans]|uniref:Thiol-disulfide isomerase n=1 Tax=Steroidobacter agaridevorans TaxID=2695856 RepID=A0A829Y6F5_9GAMM|nr:redoxin domain-containing protein [Steroidobacter agaridevorans]GFE78834.1 thiol-disulfide isomerase [Steroidobacter agaridevorans]GFE87989.1 thiol-disulfide isomerase [Steroidobacter agaridevorans]
MKDSAKRALAALIMTIGLTTQAVAVEPGQVVDNFRLLDQQGKSHELYYLSDMKAVVLMVQGNGCPIVRQALPALAEVRAKYRAQGVEFLLLNSNLQDTRELVAKEASEFKIDFPILLDDSQLIGEALGVVRTSEVFVIDPKGWQLKYRGPMDDRLSYERQRPAKHHYLTDALDAVLAGKPVQTPQADGVGCLVNFPERDRKMSHNQISYSKEIAPLLKDRCVVCHQVGGVGPWAMTNYDMVKGFAPMIREVLRTQRMPPWHADPHYGTFENARGLTSDQRKLLVHWIEAGAPRGSGDDPLLAVKPEIKEWKHGKPDLIVEIPAYDIPATGVIEYQYPRVKNPLGRDVWITAVEIHPGAKQAIHHIIANDPVVAGSTGERSGGNLAGFAPGMEPIVYPQDTGVLFPKDADFVFQMHYTPNGKAVTDHSKVGFYFREASNPPKYPLHLTALTDFKFEIPPGAKEHTTTVTRPIQRDMLIYNIMPHSHLRGRAGTMTAVYPDGREEILLNVPKYDFNWQTVYEYRQPKTIPAGSKLVWRFSWDNSTQNPANPDPSKPVRWGDQTFEEMGIGFVRFRYLDETTDTRSQKTAALDD